MLPIFSEYIKFLNDTTNNKLDFLKEGMYWYDNSIIKAFDINGNIIKVARIHVDDALKISVSFYNKQVFFLETWKDTINRYSKRLYELEQESLETITKAIFKYSGRSIAVLSSGGKDSSVTSFLVNKCVDRPSIIFNNTSLDCADTYLHIKKEENLTIINPEEGFYQWIKKEKFIPTRFSRACCDIFKEGAMTKYLSESSKYLFFMGMRNSESANRSKYNDEWKNHKWESREWDATLPIRKWSDLEIWLYILKNNIPINSKYKKGYRRVGCGTACPFYTKTTWVLDEYWYPSMRKRWKDILIKDFRENNKDLRLNCTEKEYLTCWNGGLFRAEATEQVIKEYADRNNLDVEIAKKSFGNKCKCCGKKIKTKEVIGMNMKFIGRNAKDIYCKTHLKQKLNINNKDWNLYIEQFKLQECALF